MKNYFAFDIRGRDWWLPVLAYWFVAVVFDVPILFLNAGNAGNAGSVLAFFIVFIFALSITLSLAYVAVLRTAIPKLSIGAHVFSFRGSMGRFLGMNLLGALLSLVTLGVYLPWWERRVVAYLVSETQVDGEAPAFRGRAGTLFKYLFLCIYLPLIVLFGALALYGAVAHNASVLSQTFVTTLVTFFYLLLFIVYSIYLYLSYRWLVQIQWRNRTVGWKTRFWGATGMVLGQLLLSIITAFIYSPAAIVRLHRYFAARTVLDGPDGEVGRLGFDGSPGRGFLVMWGQGLLSLVTVGIFLPWAYARVMRWVAERTYYERVAPALTPIASSTPSDPS